MKKLWCLIKAYFIALIVYPITRWWNLNIRHIYIPANERNEQALDYFTRVTEDPTTQPQTPVEHYFENLLRSDWEEQFKECSELTWEEDRQYIFSSLANEMLQYVWIDDRNIDD